jgi:hypothetical protein
MKYIKLFEEFNRITVTPEEKRKIKKIALRTIELVNNKIFQGGLHEKWEIEYDLGALQTFIQNNKYVNQQVIDQHRNNGYKIVDEIAKQLSKRRGIEIIYDRKDNCFKTKSGKAFTIFNLVSKISHLSEKEQNPHFWPDNIYVFVNYKTGEVFNKLDEYSKKVDKSDYIIIWDFSGGNIYLPINKLREMKKDDLNVDIFSLTYHEFIHAKDPDAWVPKNYATPAQIKAGVKGSYGSNPAEIQTMCNNLLEIVGYYFERTWRGDTDGGGINMNLTKTKIVNEFLPTIFEVRNFINGKRDNLSDTAKKQLAGNNKTLKVIEIIIGFINEAKKDAPDKMKIVQEWMKEDFIKLLEIYNKKVTEINNKKYKLTPANDKIPLIPQSYFS